MKVWHDQDGEEFRNSDVCFGREYNPTSKQLNIAKILIGGNFPASGWSYNEEADEMAVVTRGSGSIHVKDGEPQHVTLGDVIYFAAGERFRWSGDLDVIVACGPAFEPTKHHIEGDL